MPLEADVEAFLVETGLPFTRPECDQADPATLDFLIPSLRLYIEVKRSHTDRINNQIARVPTNFSVIILVGGGAPEALRSLINVCRI